MWVWVWRVGVQGCERVYEGVRGVQGCAGCARVCKGKGCKGACHVIWLEVSVEDVQLVQVLRCEHDLRRIEHRALVRVRPTHQVGVPARGGADV